MLRVYLACFALLAGCEVHVGDGSSWQFDGGGGWPDGGSGDDEDTGPRGEDAGTEDAGARDSGTKPIDAGSDAGRDAGAPPAVDPVKLVSETLAQGFCDAIVQCMGPELAPEFLAGQSCNTFLAKQLADRENHWIGESVQRGRVELHADMVADCSAALKAQGCAVVASRLPSACEEAVAGSVALGGECSISADCQGRAYCKKDGEVCPGHCTNRAARGDSCSASTDCDDGLLCRAAKCTPAPIEGDPCSTHMSWCAPGLVCQGEPNKAVCATIQSVYMGNENDACDAYGALCSPELVCVSEGGREGRCERRAASGGVCGASLPAQCPTSEFCADPSTGERVAAAVSGVCTSKPGPGKACGDTGCQPGSTCGNGMCVTYGVTGDDCVSDATCYGGRCSDGQCAVAATNCELY